MFKDVFMGEIVSVRSDQAQEPKSGNDKGGTTAALSSH